MSEIASDPAKPRRARLLVIFVLLVALAIFFLPIPSGSTLLLASERAMIGRGIQVTGNSVVSHVSVCDVGGRPLAAMIGDSAGSRVADASFPGQPLEQSIGLADLGLSNHKSDRVVILVSLAQLIDTGRANLQTQSFFRLAAGAYPSFDLKPRLHALAPISEGTRSKDMAFAYKGVTYPAYDKLKTQYLLPERNAQHCPETIGQNRAFIEALYWADYLRTPINPGYIADLRRLSDHARAARKRLVIALLPIDFADVDTLNPALTNAIRTRRDEALRLTRAAGLDMLDLSDGVPADAFADRWCGCGHLQTAGRQFVATRVAQALKEPVHAL